MCGNDTQRTRSSSVPQAESRLPPGKLWPDRYPVPTKMTARKRFNLGYPDGEANPLENG